MSDGVKTDPEFLEQFRGLLLMRAGAQIGPK